ncbi:MAG: hypothetical protein ACLSFJ_04390 [Holdemania filiformis]
MKSSTWSPYESPDQRRPAGQTGNQIDEAWFSWASYSAISALKDFQRPMVL